MTPGSLGANCPVSPFCLPWNWTRQWLVPFVGVNISESLIHKHLDNSLSSQEKNLRSSAHKRKLLTHTVQNLLSDCELKKKLNREGLSFQRNEQQLVQKHQEFAHMYNAQYGALHPKSAAENRQEVKNTEKARVCLESRRHNVSVMTLQRNKQKQKYVKFTVHVVKGIRMNSSFWWVRSGQK